MPSESDTQFLPVLPLRNVVIYPHMVTPLFVGREKSIAALDAAMADDKRVFLVAQCSSDVDDPTIDDVFAKGTVANVLQLLKLPDDTVKVLVEGESRAAVKRLDVSEDGYLLGQVELLEEPEEDNDKEISVMTKSVRELFEQYVKVHKKVPSEVLPTLDGIDNPSRLVDTIAVHMSLQLEQKQAVLETLGVSARFEKVMGLIEGELDVMQVEKRIRGRVKQQMEKSQREYYLNEQMKAIQKELGDMEDTPNELEDLSRRVQEAGMPQEAFDKAQSELGKLRQMSPMSAEATVVRNYIDTLLGVPWVKRSRVKADLSAAQKILDRDHFGLEKVKERILEYLAVQKRVRKLKGPILCLVGPPGVGKTSLGRSLAASTGRKFVRMSLGGLRDEAEIRGHRRTYIGSMPGKIVQNLSKVGTRNPLMLLDEIDKMSMDFRGDPSSAMLEVLDPEQNSSFADHYLEVDVDLSDVMFVATANSLNIPAPLLDRMEVIRIAGYTENEKLNIARRYLLPKAIKETGLKADELSVSDDEMLSTIRYYTREAGVRGLERELNKLCRKAVKDILTGEQTAPIEVDASLLESYLGVQKYRYGLAEQNDQIGQVTGLAWTEVGGELLTIEAGVVSGKGKLHITGQLGDVMQESIQAAHTVVRSRAQSLGLTANFYEKLDIHIHVPEGATPKDGPSAGIGMCTAMVSALTSIPVRCDVAMTGEITLRGEVLPIGGLKEKLLAANRGGITQVIIPFENEKDLAEVPKDILDGLNVVAVRWIDEVLALALTDHPKPLDAETLDVVDVDAVAKETDKTQLPKH